MSTDINSVILVGRLTRDASVDYLPSGSPVASISIAVNRGKKEGEQWVNEVNFFDVSLFGKSAENLKQYLLSEKNANVYIERIIQSVMTSYTIVNHNDPSLLNVPLVYDANQMTIDLLDMITMLFEHMKD